MLYITSYYMIYIVSYKGILNDIKLQCKQYMYPSSSKGRRKLGLSSKTLFYFESLFYSYPVFEGRLSRPIEHTIYSTFQPCLLNYSTMTSKGKKGMACPSKEHTYLTQSACLIPWPFYGIVMPCLACFFPC